MMNAINDSFTDPEAEPIIRKWSGKGYHIEQTLDHNDIVPFVIENLKKLNLVTFIFYLSNAAGIIAFITYTYIHFDSLSFWQILSSIALGPLLIIPMIPVHELLPDIAYKLAGARTVTYGANWQQLYFTASAHLFVAGYLKFLFIGLLPFVAINLFGAYIIIELSARWGVMVIFFLVLHNTMCAGDFGILGYFHEKRNMSPVTFDDVKNQLSYFLVKGSN